MKTSSTESDLCIRTFTRADTEAVVALWRDAGLVVPWNDPYQDIERKLAKDVDLFLVGVEESALVASVMGGYEGHRGWVNYLAVESDKRKHRYGQQMMAEVEKRLRLQGCPKVNLQIRTSNEDVVDFYRTLGYSVDDVVCMGKRIQEH